MLGVEKSILYKALVMAISSKQRQKKLERKRKKKKGLLAKKNKDISVSQSKAANYASLPIYECLVPDALFEIGIGNVIVSRRTPTGNITFGAFLVDVFCLGVKSAFLTVVREFDYENKVKASLMMSDELQTFESIHPECAKKLVEGAMAYAKELGFSHHQDYENAKNIFGDIVSSNCPVKYKYGKDGKPFYIRGPNETMAEAKEIVNQLHQRCGEDGFDYLVILGEGSIP